MTTRMWEILQNRRSGEERILITVALRFLGCFIFVWSFTMHQTMEICMARKKRVPSHYNPDSYRIFDGKITDASLGESRLNKAHTGRKKDPPPPHPRDPERRNCPQPWHSRFLTNNVKLLNKPICTIATTETDKEQNQWWASQINKESPHEPKYTINTTHRSDYPQHEPRIGITRHFSNPLIVTTPGILPVSTPKRERDPGDVLVEKTSYKHNYDCRSNPSEPIRGRLHGSFVWDNLIKDTSGKEVVSSPWTRRDITKSLSVIAGNPNKENQPVASKSTKSRKSSQVASSKTQVIPPIDGLPPIDG